MPPDIEARLAALEARDRRREKEHLSLIAAQQEIAREARAFADAFDARIREILAAANDETDQKARLIARAARELWPYIQTLLDSTTSRFLVGFEHNRELVMQLSAAVETLVARVEKLEGRLTGWQTSVRGHLETISNRVGRGLPPAA